MLAYGASRKGSLAMSSTTPDTASTGSVLPASTDDVLRLAQHTRLVQPLTADVGFSIEIPSRWLAVVDTSVGLLRAFLGGVLSNRDDSSTIEAAEAELGIVPFALLDEAALEAYADDEMKSHAAQGEPERFRDEIDGHTAVGYGWTDGVRAIATWFVAPLASIAVRIDFMTTLDRDPRADGVALLASLRWVPLSTKEPESEPSVT